METVEKLNFYNVILPLALGVFVITLGVVFLNRHFHKNLYRQQRQQEELKNQHKIELLEVSAQVQEEERKRIAADLHDRMGSMLSTVKLLYSSMSATVIHGDKSSYDNYIKASTLLDEAVLEIRRIAQDLSTGLLIDMGLPAALKELCESIDKTKKMSCRLLTYGTERRLDQKTEIGVYRMLQEIINNALKHSRARQLTLQLNYTAGALSITVEDDGIGFDPGTIKEHEGMGLKNLLVRAKKLGLHYHVDSRSEHGTISVIETPIEKQ